MALVLFDRVCAIRTCRVEEVDFLVVVRGDNFGTIVIPHSASDVGPTTVATNLDIQCFGLFKLSIGG